MPEEKVVEQEPTAPVETPVEEPKVEKPTLDSIAAQNKELNEKLEKVLKQNADKDSFISKLQGENKAMRSTVEKVSATLEGKSEKQKDAILEGHKQKFLNEGYDEKSVDLILNTIVDLAERKANERIVPMVIEAAQELVESDPEIDQEFLNKNQEVITEEYGLFKTEVSPRKIKANLKKAYKIVKERLAEKAKAEAPASGRDGMIEGAKPSGGKKEKAPEDNTIDAIEKSGSSGGHFI